MPRALQVRELEAVGDDEDDDDADSDVVVVVVDENVRFFCGVRGILEARCPLLLASVFLFLPPPPLLRLLVETSALPFAFAFAFALLLTESAPLARLLRWEKE